MKIDLHCHTKRCKKGDSPKRSVCSADFKKSVENAQVGIVAITNHNTFDLEQFDAFSNEVGQSVQLWPGVELDVCGSREGSHWHMLVIASPHKKVEFSRVLQALTNGKTADDVLIPVDSAFKSFQDVGAIFISHAHDKDPHITLDDLNEMEGLIDADEQWRLFYEPKSLVTVGIWTNHGFNMMLGSDVQDWDNYPGCELPELRLPVDSFEQFCLLAERDGATIETLLGVRGKFDVVAHPHNKVDVPLTLREDINVLFGQKGTGKTEMLKSIESTMLAEGRTCCSYYGNEKHEGFKKLLSTDNLARDPSDFGRSDGTDEIEGILSWSDASPTPLSEYVTWWKTRKNNRNKDRFKLSEAQALNEIPDDKFKSDQQAMKSLADFIAAYDDHEYREYFNRDDAAAFEALLGKLHTSIANQSKKHYIEYRSIKFANAALAKIKEEIDAKSETKSKPSATGFLSFVRTRITLKENAEKLKKALKPIQSEKEFKTSYLGELDDKGSACIVTRYRYLTKESRTQEFSLGIQILRKWKDALEELCDEALGASANPKQREFAKLCKDNSVTNLSPFIGIT
ncbi:MAG: PHP domain-containing protein, partial [Planifilum sp.]